MTPIDTAELERLAASITPGEWYAHETHPQNACAYVSARREFMDHEIATLYHGESDNAGLDEAGIWGDHPERRANARAIALVPALIREVLAHRKAEAWRPISSAPFHTPVIVKVGQMTFPAVLRGNAAMDENGQDCAQWQAMNEGEHPPCWSDGACWASNADGLTSMQPTGWKPATTEAEGGCDAE
ncbi:hypothetical protein ACDP63_11345 [Paracoccus sp. P2]|uniref:hypothetical protein n=1 Tax=Paracoccus sp. P2 TaxID=3248840 RepID=UPI00391FAA44